MKQYLDMVKYVLDNGVKKENRTGVGTISNFAYFYKYYWWDITNTDNLCTNKGGPVSGPWPWVEINGNKLESWK